MARKQQTSNLEKDPSTWATGQEPMTDAQKSYLHTLADGAGKQVDDHMTKGEASKKIDELRHQAGEHHKSVDEAPVANVEKDPSTWVTGNEPMTEAQKSYLSTLSAEAGETLDESMSKGEASKKIEELRSGNSRVQASKRRSKKTAS